MQRFKNILLYAEPLSAARPALKRALTLSANNQADLTLASVIPRVTAGLRMPDGGPISTELQTAMRRDQRDRLEALRGDVDAETPIRTDVWMGTGFIEVIRAVMRHEFDLVIKPATKQDWMDHLLGSEEMHLLRKCPCPVWLQKEGDPKPYRQIVAAIDVNPFEPEADLKINQQLNRDILRMAAALALSEFAELHVIHVWDAIGEPLMRGPSVRLSDAEVDDYIEEVERHHAKAFAEALTEVELVGGDNDFLQPHTHLIKGTARREILALTQQLDADLLVMGTLGRTGVAGLFMGNTAESILNQIQCSVLALKPEGFQTPVGPA